MDKSKKLAIVVMGILLTMSVATVASAQDYTYTYTDPNAAAFLGIGMAVCAVFAIIWLVIWILVGIWVYKDAEKRGKSGVLWLILVILLGIIGIIIWLVIRPPIGGEKTEPSRRCPNCGRPIPMDARVCPYCSKKFEE